MTGRKKKLRESYYGMYKKTVDLHLPMIAVLCCIQVRAQTKELYCRAEAESCGIVRSVCKTLDLSRRVGGFGGVGSE